MESGKPVKETFRLEEKDHMKLMEEVKNAGMPVIYEMYTGFRRV